MTATCRHCRKTFELAESPLGGVLGAALGISVATAFQPPLVALAALIACTFAGDRLDRHLRSRCAACQRTAAAQNADSSIADPAT